MFRKYYQKEVINEIVRKKVEMIPEKTFREALANALVHRVWDINSDITVFMYNDRIEIVSHGGHSSETSEDQFLNSKLSYLRNPNIAYLFLRLNYIVKLGTGILRIKECYKNNLFKPKFFNKDNSITIILPTLTDLNESLLTEELMILDEIEMHYEVNIKTLEEGFNLSKDKRIRLLNKLIDFDLVQKEGKGKNIKYKINQ